LVRKRELGRDLERENIMKPSVVRASILASFLAGTAMGAVEKGDIDLFLAFETAGLTWTQTSDNGDTLSLGIGGGIGYFVSPNIEINGDLGVHYIDYDNRSTTSYGVGAGCWYHFLPNAKWVPYAGAGVSWWMNDFGAGGDSSSVEFRPGVGVRTEINKTNDIHISARASWFSGDEADYTDMQVSIMIGWIHQLN
jgi:hypothetical protein